MVTCPKCNERGLHFEQRGGDLRLYTKDRLRHLCSGGKKDMFERHAGSYPAAEQMTIRDHFAAAALTGLMSTGMLSPETLAKHAYKISEAMLKAREDHKK